MQYYDISQDDVIVAVDPDWDKRLLDVSPSARLSTNDIVGLNMIQVITGKSVQLSTKACFDWVRTHKKPLTTRYGCDAPYTQRVFEMAIEYLDANTLRVHHRLLKQTKRLETKVSQRKLELNVIERCSLCCDFGINAQWMNAGDISMMLDVCENSLFKNAKIGLCQDCESHITKLTKD